MSVRGNLVRSGMAVSNSDFYERLGAAIRKGREGAGLTQSDLARLLDLSRTTVTNIEAGRQRLLADQLRDIASVLGVQADELLPKKSRQAHKSTSADIQALEMPNVARFIAAMRDVSNGSQG